MKSQLLTIFLFLSTNVLLAQWMDISSHRNDIQFVNDDLGWMVGDKGSILKTTDGGINWVNQQSPVEYDNQLIKKISLSNNGKNIRIIAYVPHEGGADVPSIASIYSSTDAGLNWKKEIELRNSGIDEFFINENIGWYITRDGSDSKTYKTVDGGKNWVEDVFLRFAYEFHFNGVKNGWSLVRKQDSTFVYQTKDEGKNWTLLSKFDPEKDYIHDDSKLYFVNDTLGWLVQTFLKKDLYKTIDGGKTWIKVSYQDGNLSYSDPVGVNSIKFINDKIGFIIGKERRTIYKTTDGGITWKPVFSPPNIYDYNMNVIYFFNDQRGMVAGENGYFAYTNDGGNNWTQTNFCVGGNNFPVDDIQIENNAIWMTGRGLLLQSKDQGKNWKSYLDSNDDYSSIDFLTNGKGILIGERWLSTIDSGETWSFSDHKFEGDANEILTRTLDKVYYRSEDDIWITTANGGIYQSTDGGLNFKLKRKSRGSSIWLSFPSKSNIWAWSSGNDLSYALKSTNGGIDWIDTREYLGAIHFLNESIGWKITDKNELYKTLDGGHSWTLILNINKNSRLRYLFFADEEVGWVADKQGKIFQTTDGGNNWKDNISGRNYTPTNTMKFFIDKEGNISGFLAGEKVLKYVGNYKTKPVINVEAPTQLGVVSKSATKIAIQWEDNSSEEEGYIVERKLGLGSFQKIATVSSNSTLYKDSGLTPNQTYWYRVAAFKRYIVNYSSETSIITNDTILAPTNFTADIQPISKIRLRWKDNSNNEIGFVIQQSEDGLAFKELKRIPANTNEYYDSTVVEEKIYYYRISAFNSATNSAFAEKNVIIPLELKAPDHLSVTYLNGAIKLMWINNNKNEDFTIIERSEINSTNFIKLDSTTTGITSYIDNSTLPSKTYFYRLYSRKVTSRSSYSNQIEAKLPVVTSLQDPNLFYLKAYPNPSLDIFHIELSQNFNDLLSYQIIDNKGKIIVTEESVYNTRGYIILNLSAYPSGIYLVRLKIHNNYFSIRVLKI